MAAGRVLWSSCTARLGRRCAGHGLAFSFAGLQMAGLEELWHGLLGRGYLATEVLAGGSAGGSSRLSLFWRP